MIPWVELDRVKVPEDESEIILRQRDTEFSIRTTTTELMNSRVHGSEDALAELACSRLRHKHGLEVLIGGLGMGYTLAAALQHSEQDAHITVAELIPAVIRWNKLYLGHLAGMPLDDPRVSVQQGDVAKIISIKKKNWDAILLDVDNGPDGLTREANNCLYGIVGLKQSFEALRPGGILAVWSYAQDDKFTQLLNKCRFTVEIKTVRARKPGKGSRHTIWLATKPM